MPAGGMMAACCIVGQLQGRVWRSAWGGLLAGAASAGACNLQTAVPDTVGPTHAAPATAAFIVLVCHRHSVSRNEQYWQPGHCSSHQCRLPAAAVPCAAVPAALPCQYSQYWAVLGCVAQAQYCFTTGTQITQHQTVQCCKNRYWVLSTQHCRGAGNSQH